MATKLAWARTDDQLISGSSELTAGDTSRSVVLRRPSRRWLDLGWRSLRGSQP